MWRWFRSTLHKLDGYARKNASSGRYVQLTSSHVVYLTPFHSFMATLPHPARSGRRSSPKDRRSSITPTNSHARKTTTGDTALALDRRPLVNNEASVFRNLSPVLKEGTPPLGEQLSDEPSNSHCPSSTGSTAVRRLAMLLSLTKSSDVASVDNLVSLYKIASQQSLLQRLSAEQLTEILSICGTLSLPFPRLSSVYDSHLVPFFQPPSANTNYWSFVLKVSRDKKRLSHNLTLQDRYWVMRACLARISRVVGGTIRAGKSLIGPDF